MPDPEDFGGETVPGYFNSKTKEVPEDVLKGHGEQLIKGLKELLDEAYYSIACDYWISYYLQWHRYGLKGDPLAPYFELYRLGYSAIFSEQKLYIGS